MTVPYQLGDELALFDACMERRADGPVWALFQRVLRAYVTSTTFQRSKHRVAVAWRKRPRTWWGRIGLAIQGGRGAPGLYEHNYHCIVCGENLATYAGGRIHSDVQDWMMNHVGMCLKEVLTTENATPKSMERIS